MSQASTVQFGNLKRYNGLADQQSPVSASKVCRQRD
jgi:hypothetical protein